MTKHVAGGSAAFFEDVQACYERFMPGTERGIRLPDPDALAPDTAAVTGSGLFEAPEVRRYLWQESYTSAAYIDLLTTYSDHLEMLSDSRASLFECIAALIDSRFGGSIVKQYMTEMVIAGKRG